MTSSNVPGPPVGYKIPRPLRTRLHRIRDYYERQLGRGVTLPDALERMTAECERLYGLVTPAEVSNNAEHGGE